MNDTEILHDVITTPIGDIAFYVHGTGLCVLDFKDNVQRIDKILRKQFGKYRLTKSSNPFGISDKLKAYFEGDLEALKDIPLNMHGTDFQKTVWAALIDIPAGKTESYADLADRIQNPKAVRAVGMANGLNPVSIIVPCHRVIGKNGTLTGYAGGTDRKAWLLRHEKADFIQ